MTNDTTAPPSRSPRPWHRRPALLVGAGLVLLFLSQLRWGVGLLAWIAPVPILRYLRITGSWRARALLGAGLLAAWIATSLKIVTAPLSPAFALPVGLGLGAMAFLAYLTWDLLRGAMPAPFSPVLFAASATVAEWLQHRATPLASWGAAAYTQLGDLPLLQVASLAGMAGVGFLVNWGAAWLEEAASARLDGGRLPWRQGIALALVLAAAHAWGAARIRDGVPGEKTTVAAVGTTATFTGFPIPQGAERERIVETLLEDSARAAAAGARLVVWNEAATVVPPGGEQELLVARGLRLAHATGIDLVMAFIVPRSERPPSFENEYVWVSPAGVRQVYEKHHPAPGEPAVVGRGPLSPVLASFGTAGGAICYDYDYPSLALEHARLGVGLVALPSSDWRGIDPLHTQMAAMRAIEGGFSILRSTRFGLSAAIDSSGRFVASRSSFEVGGDRVLLAELPTTVRPTAYARIGDLLPLACLAGLGILAVRNVWRRRALGAPRHGIP